MKTALTTMGPHGVKRGSTPAPVRLGGWPGLLFWAAVATFALLAAVGLSHFDREALAFAVLVLICLGLIAAGRPRRRIGLAGLVLLGLIFLDVAFWMVTATYSNVRNHEQLVNILEPLGLAAASVGGLIAALGTLLSRRDPDAGHAAAPAVGVATIAAFIIVLAAAAVIGWGQEQTRGPDDIALNIHNTAYSTTAITAKSHQVTLYVTNQDLFWHTVTIEKLGVEIQMPIGGHRRFTFTAPPGTYTYYCRIPGHRQAGMQGTITIP